MRPEAQVLATVVALFACGGVLLGAAWALRSARRPWPVVITVLVLALACIASGVLQAV